MHGGENNIRYSPLTQVTKSNVSQLKVAWTWDAGDAFKGSEMQSNPVVVDGVLYATTPTLKVVALDAATGRELWKFDPSNGAASGSRFRHRGVVVHGDRVFVTYRNWLYALHAASGQPIASFQGIRWKLADLATRIEAARLLTYRAAALKDEGVRTTRESSMAKLYASEVAVRAAEECVQIHGGYGFVKDYPAEKFFRDVKLLTIGEGTSEVQRLVIARQLLA